jgi:hypothetical protein
MAEIFYFLKYLLFGIVTDTAESRLGGVSDTALAHL